MQLGQGKRVASQIFVGEFTRTSTSTLDGAADSTREQANEITNALPSVVV